MRFLLRLLDTLLPLRETKALVESATLQSLAVHAVPTTHRLARSTVTSLLPYRVPIVRALIHEAKYYDNKKATALLGAVLSDYLLSYSEDRQFDAKQILLVPVPLGPKRLRERGFNQVERVVYAALAQLPKRYQIETNLVARVSETAPQARRSRGERLGAMNDTFSVAGDVPTGSDIIVLDDVATTGATLSAVQTALASRGCSTVLLALAH
jgi:competence protein ComFC